MGGDMTRMVRITIIRWKGKTVILGRNQAMKMLLEQQA
jgi:hypothetical protein